MRGHASRDYSSSVRRTGPVMLTSKQLPLLVLLVDGLAWNYDLRGAPRAGVSISVSTADALSTLPQTGFASAFLFTRIQAQDVKDALLARHLLQDCEP